MKLKRYIITIAVMMATLLPTTASAQNVVTPKLYMFGFAASFNDTIVHFTDIQTLDSVWVNKKTNFLLARDVYSNMLRNYLATQQQPYRTCVVFYDRKLKKLQKKYLKMKKLYEGSKRSKVKNNNDIRIIPTSDFKFTVINLGVPIEEEVEE